jgi:hypothetical protein
MKNLKRQKEWILWTGFTLALGMLLFTLTVFDLIPD